MPTNSGHPTDGSAVLRRIIMGIGAWCRCGIVIRMCRVWSWRVGLGRSQAKRSQRKPGRKHESRRPHFARNPNEDTAKQSIYRHKCPRAFQQSLPHAVSHPRPSQINSKLPESPAKQSCDRQSCIRMPLATQKWSKQCKHTTRFCQRGGTMRCHKSSGTWKLNPSVWPQTLHTCLSSLLYLRYATRKRKGRIKRYSHRRHQSIRIPPYALTSSRYSRSSRPSVRCSLLSFRSFSRSASRSSPAGITATCCSSFRRSRRSRLRSCDRS